MKKVMQVMAIFVILFKLFVGVEVMAQLAEPKDIDRLPKKIAQKVQLQKVNYKYRNSLVK